MFQPANQIFDLSGSGFSARHFQRREIAERTIGLQKPAKRLVAFKQFNRLRQETSYCHQAIRFRCRQFILRFAACQRTRTHPNGNGQTI